MTNDETIRDVRHGRFARVKLRNGPAVDGFAGSDPEDAQFLRLDGMVLNDDGRLSEMSLRLLPEQIVSIEVLCEAPRFPDADGSFVVMPRSFWS